MKIFEHIMHWLGFIGAGVKGMDNYMTGQDWTWQAITLVWIANSYILVQYVNRVEKKLKESKA